MASDRRLVRRSRIDFARSREPQMSLFRLRPLGEVNNVLTKSRSRCHEVTEEAILLMEIANDTFRRHLQENFHDPANRSGL